MARASAASKGHNWRLKVFTRALIQMEGLHIPLVRPVLFHLIIIYMNLHRPSCPCSPVFKQIKFYLCNKYKFTLQQILYHKYKIVQLLKGHGRRRTRFCGHTRGNSCYPPCYPGFWNNMKSELNVEDNHVTILSQTLQWYYWKISLLKWGSLYELGFLDPINILSQILQWYYWKINLLECGSIYGFGILMLVTVQLNILSQILQW